MVRVKIFFICPSSWIGGSPFWDSSLADVAEVSKIALWRMASLLLTLWYGTHLKLQPKSAYALEWIFLSSFCWWMRLIDEERNNELTLFLRKNKKKWFCGGRIGRVTYFVSFRLLRFNWEKNKFSCCWLAGSSFSNWLCRQKHLQKNN